ncbi:hypothetical protein [Flavobacterium sp. H4147]|uniref:hypothetical protein n=1 Tax=Flavobacterium sp. H4147 TaxID=3034149 RepID=UPI0023EB04CD|nr:hypothetical protein [Flavobacterium sp. H4147]
MKGFIKITDMRKDDHYLNVDYIVKISRTGNGHAGSSFIWVVGTEKPTIFQTDSTPEEIIEMINLAKS